MARRTFGRAGQPIEVPASADHGTITISEAELDGIPVSIDDNGRVEIIDSVDSTDADDGSGDFEPVGDIIRTQPIADNSGGYSDPASVAGKRPRKPRGPNKPKQTGTENTRVISAQLDAMLFGLHTMAATMMHSPDFAISVDESKVLAEAIEKMANAYTFSAILSPKTAATIDLLIALGIVYGPRVMKVVNKPRNIRNVTNIDKAQ